jgi:hypothetical protein
LVAVFDVAFAVAVFAPSVLKAYFVGDETEPAGKD